MQIYYLSAAASDRLIDKIKLSKGKDPGYAVQKFNKLVIKGLIENGCNLTVKSNVPIDSTTNSELFFSGKETEDGIIYNYTPFINRKALKQITIFLNTFFSVLKWGLTKKSDKVVICDGLSISQSLAAVLARIFNGIRVVGIMTDMPGLMVTTESSKSSYIHKFKRKFVTAINKLYLHHFSHYVLLTDAMNPIMNPHNKPYIVMEALCDPNMCKICTESKYALKTIMYAGGLHEKYGLKTLVEAFMRIKDPNIRLLIYGSGPYATELKRLSQIDKRISYMGLAPNSEVVNAELKSFILVNPRPTTEEFTKYSFPSKNMEYMASGTPLLSTNLPGMPTEYHEYIYLFEDESVEGFHKTLQDILKLKDNEVNKKGIQAKQWVLENKNFIVQANRILNIISY